MHVCKPQNVKTNPPLRDAGLTESGIKALLHHPMASCQQVPKTPSKNQTNKTKTTTRHHQKKQRPRHDRDITETSPKQHRDKTETRPRKDRDKTETSRRQGSIIGRHNGLQLHWFAQRCTIYKFKLEFEVLLKNPVKMFISVHHQKIKHNHQSKKNSTATSTTKHQAITHSSS